MKITDEKAELFCRFVARKTPSRSSDYSCPHGMALCAVASQLGTQIWEYIQYMLRKFARVLVSRFLIMATLYLKQSLR
jgi:hypothetical protein